MIRRFRLAAVLIATTAVALSGCDRPPEEDTAARPPAPAQNADRPLELTTDSGA
ncbi:MAG: hypothetical protein JKY06_06425, partial [Alcanivorax sp.]|nr:hypothetical protein [Alcanivorax sp.]